MTERIFELSGLFAIDVAAYAVMSNHYHLVLHLAPERAANWTDEDVLLRWTKLYPGPLLVRRYLSSQRLALDRPELERVREYVVIFRDRLQDLS